MSGRKDVFKAAADRWGEISGYGDWSAEHFVANDFRVYTRDEFHKVS